MNSKNIIVAFDGGGTSSRFLIGTSNGVRRSVHYNESVRPSELTAAVSARRIISLLIEAGIAPVEISAMMIVLAGAGNTSTQIEMTEILSEHLSLEPSKIRISSDAAFLIDTAYPDSSGYAAILGTGTVYLAKTRSGSVHKIGGWGRTFGDEGGGYDIARRALTFYCHCIDGMQKKDLLFEVLHSELSSQASEADISIRELIQHNRLDHARITKLVLRSNITRHIVIDAVKAVERSLHTLRNIAADGDDILTLHGGLTQSEEFMKILRTSTVPDTMQVRTLTSGDILDAAFTKAMRL
jgi:N-acetylglucosamine kinase-like BadF-type ATPase